ncbi:OmpP1/FadL family transporter [Ferrimonas pelagia]|uniref:TonB-dependent receptor n=1 Tax=Ferrimonas pelagia TaxID=1177826 RepID=A0ABP9F0F6_9GAMM
MKLRNKALIVALATAMSAPTLAAGFGLNSQSANGMGRAFAGDAIIADNAAVMARNPAAMALFDRPALSMGLAFVDMDSRITNAHYAGGSLNDIDDAAQSSFIPNIHYIHPLNDTWAVGVSAHSNFGSKGSTTSLYKGADTGMLPYDLIGDTEVVSMNLNGSVSYRVNEYLSFGAGLDIIYGQGTLTRMNDAMVADADGVAFGGVLGATFELNENHRWGMSYRVSPTVTATGDIGMNMAGQLPIGQITFTAADLSDNPLAVAIPIEFALSNLNMGINADFDELELPMPDVFQFAGFHQLTDRFAVHYTAQWTQWSAFDQVTARGGYGSLSGSADLSGRCTLPFGCNSNIPGLGLSANDIIGMLPPGGEVGIDGIALGDVALKEFGWKDSWMLSIGGTYDVSDKLALRAGYGRDMGVVDQIETISFPDSDRNWYSVGASYKLSASSAIDMGFLFIRGEEVNVIEDSSFVGPVNATTITDGSYYSIQYSRLF